MRLPVDHVLSNVPLKLLRVRICTSHRKHSIDRFLVHYGDVPNLLLIV